MVNCDSRNVIFELYPALIKIIMQMWHIIYVTETTLDLDLDFCYLYEKCILSYDFKNAGECGLMNG